METPPGLVGVTEPGVGQLQLVSVSGTDFLTIILTYSRTEIPCSDLPTLMVSYNAGSPDIRPVNTGATYSCNSGYALTGNTITRVCMNEGIWSGSAPTCQGKAYKLVVMVNRLCCLHSNLS